MAVVSGPIEAALREAIDFHRLGMLGQAEQSYRSILKRAPDQFDALHMLGILRLQVGAAEEARQLLTAAVNQNPGSFQAWSNLCAVLLTLNRNEEALDICRRLLAIEPRSPDTLSSEAAALNNLGRHSEALTSCDAALAIDPGHLYAQFNRGHALARLNRNEEALASFNAILARLPTHVDALNNRANVLAAVGRHSEALADYDRAIAIRPNDPNTLTNRGNALKALGRPDEALAAYERTLSIAPRFANALFNRSMVLSEINRLEDALADVRAALTHKPDDRRFLLGLGLVLQKLARHADAVHTFDRVITTDPSDADALFSRGYSLSKLGRLDEAIKSYEAALQSNVSHPHVFGALLWSRLAACDWSGVAALADQLPSRLADGVSVIGPFVLTALPLSPAEQMTGAKAYLARTLVNAAAIPPPPAAVRSDARIRVAYVSADFRQHVVATVIAELLERHDKTAFEIVGFSLGPDDGSELRQRLVRSMDRFHDVASASDREVARLIRDCGIAIAIDLMGFTENCRPGIFAHRPAPIQASYLGYPGTMGTAFIDYIIADPVVLPFAQQPFYTEKIVHLPDSYQPTDSRRTITAGSISRAEIGLPESSFVFACFNSTTKISGAIFEVWMRILGRVEGSVLWISVGNDLARNSLRKAAAARGIDPDRLVLTPRMRNDAYLASQTLADLFLDTLPYNAHATGSNALQAGLPLLTCLGETFAGRVGASMLRAAGLPELIAQDVEEYEDLAVALAGQPARLMEIRQKLQRRNPTAPLFDTDRLRRHLEVAYATMWRIYLNGEAPRSFAVDPLN